MASSFLEKLKRGMGIEEVTPEQKEPEKVQRERPKKSKESEREKEKISKKVTPSVKEKTEVTQEEKEREKVLEEKKEDWLEPEGQLVVDVFQTEENLYLQSPIAGVKAEDLDIELEKDILTIRGERKNPTVENAEYLIKECYWGRFSRQIILPVEIDPNRIEAFLKEGILTIKMPKLLREKKRKIVPQE